MDKPIRKRGDIMTPAIVIGAVVVVIILLWVVIADGQTHTMPGSNVVPSGASLTIQSGGTITAAPGSTITGFGGGGGGTPGGSTTQLQYNNAGAFGGATNVTTDGTSLILKGATADSVSLQSSQDDVTLRNTVPNTATYFRVMPNGSVANFPSAFTFYGTDRVADPSNYERLFIYGKGTADTYYVIGTDAAGTGTRRPLLLTADASSTQLLLTTTGNVSVGTSISGNGTVPTGGTTGQVLKKNTNTNYDVVWGAAGTIGGSTGATDNAILKANGTGGATLQSSGVTIDATNNFSGFQRLYGTGSGNYIGWGDVGFGDIFGTGSSVVGYNAGQSVKFRDNAGNSYFSFDSTNGLVLTKNLNVNSPSTIVGLGAVPTGGSTGQVLSKSSNTDYALNWTTPTVYQAASANLTTWSGIAPGTNVGTWIATPSSANLRGALTDENGTGVALFNGATTPDFTTGFTIGAAAAAGKIPIGDGTKYGPSTPTWPTAAGTASYTIRSDGTNFAAYPQDILNSSVSSQSPSTSDVYLTGSNVVVAAGDFKAKGQYRCLFDVTKTAGTGAIVISLRAGTAGTTADTAQVTFTFGAGTSVADSGIFEVIATWRTVGSGTSAVLQAVCRAQHNLATTGLFNNADQLTIIGTTSSGFASNTFTNMGISFNGGTAFAGTVTLVQATLLQ